MSKKEKVDPVTIKIGVALACIFAISAFFGIVNRAYYEKTHQPIDLGEGITISKYRVGSSTVCGDNDGCRTTEIGWIEIYATFTNNSDEIAKAYTVSAYFNLYRKENIFSKEEFLGVCKVSNRRDIQPHQETMVVHTGECTEVILPDESISNYYIEYKK